MSRFPEQVTSVFQGKGLTSRLEPTEPERLVSSCNRLASEPGSGDTIWTLYVPDVIGIVDTGGSVVISTSDVGLASFTGFHLVSTC